jgi:hypothetical protein
VDLFVREAQINDAEAMIELLNPIIEAGVYTALTTPFSLEKDMRSYFHLSVQIMQQHWLPISVRDLTVLAQHEDTLKLTESM